MQPEKMTLDASRTASSWAEAVRLAAFFESSIGARNLEEFAQGVLPNVSALAGLPAVLLYVADARLTAACLFSQGFETSVVSELEQLCAGQFAETSNQTGAPPTLARGSGVELALYPLRAAHRGTIGLLGSGTGQPPSAVPPEIWERLLHFLAMAMDELCERARLERRLAHLNTYLTVSSMLAQSQGLHDLLEASLYCCMEVVSAEAGSVLLLDDERKNFRFYQIEGPAKPVLMGATFPADRGLAGAVLESRQAETINDAQHDSRFYRKVDSESGFQTRNMIAVPLVAGEQPVGVLEVLNKTGGGDFTEEERLLLVSIAEEIAFAIRNAKVFEFLAHSYCRLRQGENSCRGCKRPLGSWTPCVKNRELSIWSGD